MDQDTVYTSLGTLEVEDEEEGGITETQIMPIDGIVKIDRVREDSRQNTTTYILKEGYLSVGDISMMDVGSDDGAFLSGNLTLSGEKPHLTGKLMLSGSG